MNTRSAIPGPGALLVDMPSGQIQREVKKNLGDVPGAVGATSYRCRARARRAGRARQHVGDTARLPCVRSRRRRVGACGDEIHRRSFGRAARRDRRERRHVSGAASAVDRHGRHTIVGRLLPRASRLTHAWRADAAARGKRARNRHLAGGAAGSARSALSGAARRSRPCAVEARFSRRVGPVRRRAAAGRRRRHRVACSTACGSSAWAGAGAASKAC